MITARPRLALFIDQNVAESAARAFEAAGHQARRLRSALPTNSPDELVGAMAAAAAEILVTHDTDFRIGPEKMGAKLRRLEKLSVVHLACPEPAAAARLTAIMSLIEHEWTHAHGFGTGVLRLEIRAGLIRIAR